METLSNRRELRFWGWGYADEHLTSQETAWVESIVARFGGDTSRRIDPPQLDDIVLPPSRLGDLGDLSNLVSTSHYDRLVHAFGKSYADMARMYLREVTNAPDGVAFPRNETDITTLFEYAAKHNIALIPFGGGTSVCGGVEPAVGNTYAATLSVDMENFNQVLDIDPVARRARIQAGMLGPDLENVLKPHGLTLRHYPQSFPFVTLGGMIATRAGGHFATGYTHIDDLVEATRLVTPEGVIDTRPLPGSGAGPSADRMVLGSEGTMGIITEAWVRLQRRPVFKVSASIKFKDMLSAAIAVREISQAGLFPSNCRVLDEQEVALNGICSKRCAMLILGFESSDHSVDHWMDVALDIALKHGACLDETGVKNTIEQNSNKVDAADNWRNAFIRMPYWRNYLTGFGIVADTFETAITWDKFETFYRTIMTELGADLASVSNGRYALSCRFTHVYPDGPAPYFTFYFLPNNDADLRDALKKWTFIKQRSMELIAEQGGTVTHHHAVGRDHRFGYEKQTSVLFRKGLAGFKQQLDPHSIMNPGALIDPVDNSIGICGVMGKQRVK